MLACSVRLPDSPPLRLHPSLMRCENVDAFLAAGYVRPATDREIKPERPRAMKTSYSSCYGDCFGVKGRVCSAHFCECPKGRAGAYCQRNWSEPVRVGRDDQLLTFQVGIEKERERERERGNEETRKRGR